MKLFESFIHVLFCLRLCVIAMDTVGLCLLIRSIFLCGWRGIIAIDTAGLCLWIPNDVLRLFRSSMTACNAGKDGG